MVEINKGVHAAVKAVEKDSEQSMTLSFVQQTIFRFQTLGERHCENRNYQLGAGAAVTAPKRHQVTV